MLVRRAIADTYALSFVVQRDCVASRHDAVIHFALLPTIDCGWVEQGLSRPVRPTAQTSRSSRGLRRHVLLNGLNVCDDRRDGGPDNQNPDRNGDRRGDQRHRV